MNLAPFKILLVDDEESYRLLIREMLYATESARYDLDWVQNYDAGLAAMKLNQHDVFLVDYRLGDRNGLELLREAMEQGCHRPIILVTAFGDQTVALAAMTAGAADFLVKGQITADLLERSIRYAIERRRAAEALKASQDYARNIIDCSIDMVIAVDIERKIIEFNRAAERTFGYQRGEVLGRHVDVLYGDPREAQEVAQAIRQDQRCAREIINVRKNGERFPSYLAASVLRDASGNVIGAMGVSRDISEQKGAQEEIKRLNLELERRVVERTSQLETANRELREQIAERRRIEGEREVVIQRLQEALAKVRLLSGLLPICAHCKKIRDDRGYWNQIEVYIRQHSEADFTHSICPECLARIYPDLRAD